MVFLATADAEGRPQCSYKGGEPGFVRVLDERTIAFPNYDGNGMYLSTGNALVNPHVGLLFIDFEQRQAAAAERRTPRIDLDDPLLADVAGGAVRGARARRREVFPNCPRYIHRYRLVERSRFVPRRSARRPCPPGRGGTGPMTCWPRTIRPTIRAPKSSNAEWPPGSSQHAGSRRVSGTSSRRRSSSTCTTRSGRPRGGPARARGRTRRADDDADRPHRRRVARRGRAAAPRRRQLRGRLRQRRRARLHAARRDRLQHARRAHAGDGRAGDRAAPRARRDASPRATGSSGGARTGSGPRT